MERITIAAITANPAHKMPSRLLKLPYSSKKTPIQLADSFFVIGSFYFFAHRVPPGQKPGPFLMVNLDAPDDRA